MMDNARRVIQCALNPRFLSYMAPYDVASIINACHVMQHNFDSRFLSY